MSCWCELPTYGSLHRKTSPSSMPGRLAAVLEHPLGHDAQRVGEVHQVGAHEHHVARLGQDRALEVAIDHGDGRDAELLDGVAVLQVDVLQAVADDLVGDGIDFGFLGGLQPQPRADGEHVGRGVAAGDAVPDDRPRRWHVPTSAVISAGPPDRTRSRSAVVRLVVRADAPVRLVEPQHEVAEGVALEHLVDPHGDGGVGQLHHRRSRRRGCRGGVSRPSKTSLSSRSMRSGQKISRVPRRPVVGDGLLEALLDRLRRTMQAHDRVDARGDQLHTLRDHTGAMAVQRVVHGAEVVHHPLESLGGQLARQACAPAGCAATGRCSA